MTENMKKTNTWLSLIAAVLAIGALVGIAGMLSKIGSAGADPAEDTFLVPYAGAVIDEVVYPCLVEGTEPGDFYIYK